MFNVLVGNEDAHLKNVSFLLKGKSVQLAPFYDLLCTAVYGSKAYGQDVWPDRASLAWPVLGTSRLSLFDRELLIEAAEALGIKAHVANTGIQRLVALVRDESKQLLDEILLENEVILQESPELGLTLAAEARMMRSIVFVVIEQMTRQLR